MPNGSGLGGGGVNTPSALNSASDTCRGKKSKCVESSSKINSIFFIFTAYINIEVNRGHQR